VDSPSLLPSPEEVKGEIVFNQFQTKYAAELDVVLEGVTEIIRPSEKVTTNVC